MAGLLRAIRVGAVAFCCAALAAGAASAASPSAGSAPRQYLEVVPGASGPTSAPPPSATSPGAHQYVEVVPSAGGGSGSNRVGPNAAATPASSPFDAAISAVASGDKGHVLGLVI